MYAGYGFSTDTLDSWLKIGESVGSAAGRIVSSFKPSASPQYNTAPGSYAARYGAQSDNTLLYIGIALIAAIALSRGK